MAIDDALKPDRAAADRKYRQKTEVKARDRARKRAATARKEPDYERAKARLTEARADLLEMEAKQRAGVLWDAEETRAQWAQFLAGIRSHLETTAPLMAQRFPDLDPAVLDWVREHLSGTW